MGFFQFDSLETFCSPIRTTSCGHSFCEKCLISVRKIQASERRNQFWTCPECRLEHHCAVKVLPRNFLVEKMVGKLKEQPKCKYGLCSIHSRAIEIRKFKNDTQEILIMTKSRMPGSWSRFMS